MEELRASMLSVLKDGATERMGAIGGGTGKGLDWQVGGNGKLQVLYSLASSRHSEEDNDDQVILGEGRFLYAFVSFVISVVML